MTTETPTVYDRIRTDEEGHPSRRGAPHHDLVFVQPGARDIDIDADDIELLCLSTIGCMPVPAVGDVIDLHGIVVAVAAVHTGYGRAVDGTPAVLTTVTVADASA